MAGYNPPQVETRRRRWVGPVSIAELAACIGALVCAFAPLPSAILEQHYSIGFYPQLQHSITPLSNQLPFAILDVLLVGLTVATIVTLTRAIRDAWHTRTAARILRTLAHFAAMGAVLYILFLLLWGFNYRRLPMPARLVLDRVAPSTEDVVQLGLKAIDEMNRLYAAAHTGPPFGPEWRNTDLRAAFAEVQRALSDAAPAEPGRLKRSLLGPYFRWTGVDGMVNPFGLEVLVNPDLLPFERPFVAAHEWGHLAGYATEADANFVGWLTCVRASPAAQYSGWFYLYWQIGGEVNARDRERLDAALERGPREDINAVIARLRRNEIPALQRASWKIYDQYLKANRVEAGIRSYGEVVNLILRARFEEGWTPVRRGGPPSPSREP
jgi:hypothetical protein